MIRHRQGGGRLPASSENAGLKGQDGTLYKEALFGMGTLSLDTGEGTLKTQERSQQWSLIPT